MDNYTIPIFNKGKYVISVKQTNDDINIILHYINKKKNDSFKINLTISQIKEVYNLLISNNLKVIFLSKNISTKYLKQFFTNTSPIIRVNITHYEFFPNLFIRLNYIDQLNSIIIKGKNNLLYFPETISTSKLKKCKIKDMVIINNIDSICRMTKLKKLKLVNCNIYSPLPEKIYKLELITHLNLSHNNLYDNIPNTIGKCINLKYLNLSYNKFKGYLPNELNLLTKLTYMNLSHNKFEGFIPEFLQQLTLLEKLYESPQ